MELTPKQEVAFNNAIKYATLKQNFTLLWWAFFRRKKMRKFTESIVAGCTFRFAFDQAKAFK